MDVLGHGVPPRDLAGLKFHPPRLPRTGRLFRRAPAARLRQAARRIRHSRRKRPIAAIPCCYLSLSPGRGGVVMRSAAVVSGSAAALAAVFVLAAWPAVAGPAAAGPAREAGTVASWPQFHLSANHSGNNTLEHVLKPGNVHLV